MKFGPSKIVAHAGRDNMSFGKTIRFFEQALRIEEELGIPIAHETHRLCPLYSPMNTMVLLRELPDLHINADFSHWCVVTESMLEDHDEALAIASRRAIHVHGRVGYENGPQVPDPRVPNGKTVCENTKHGGIKLLPRIQCVAKRSLRSYRNSARRTICQPIPQTVSLLPICGRFAFGQPIVFVNSSDPEHNNRLWFCLN